MTLTRMPRSIRRKQKSGMTKNVLRKEFKEDDKVLIFDSRLKIFPRKLRSRWSRPVTVTSITPFGAIGVKSEDGQEFKVNGQRLKHYFDQPIVGEEVSCFAMQ